MKIFGKTSTLLVLCLTLLAGGGCIGIYMMYERETRKTEELKVQIEELSKKENRSAIMQSINAQMEEIALQERQISDEQREAAEQQTKVAEEMRRHAEAEQQKALTAQHLAQQAEETANTQRIIAENQRTQAEFSKRVADTLSYLILARQLGNVAITQYQTGHTELANLLAYAACVYTRRYNGDLYYPTIHQALVMTSQSKRQWNRHKGPIECISFLSGNKVPRFLTCSSYGELFSHQADGSQLRTDSLFTNKSFDFRDVKTDRRTGAILAVSRTGHLLVRQNGKNIIHEISGIGHPLRLDTVGNELLIIGDRGLARIDRKSWQQNGSKPLPYKIVTVCRIKGMPFVFDDQGGMHKISSLNRQDNQRVPFSGQVTAYASSNSIGIQAYGMKDGTIYYIDRQGKSYKLVGHRSRISKIKINGWRIYSASYDGTINLWMVDNTKIEPIPIAQTNGWIIDFNFDSDKNYIWCGDYKGTLTRTIMSVPVMTTQLKSLIKRNLTRDEWNYYIGSNIPYETFTGKEAVK